MERSTVGAATSRSIGWMFGPMLASFIAVQSDFAQVYWLRLLLVALMMPVMIWSYRLSVQRLRAVRAT